MNKAFLSVTILSTAGVLAGCTNTSPVPDASPQPTPVTQDLPLNDADPNNPATQGGAAGAMLAGSNTIFMNPQMPGSEIQVTTVMLQQPGYVVIHRDNNGEPGEVIGHSALLGTDVVDARVELNEAVVDGDQLYAMLHSDDGDGVYEFPDADEPIVDETTGEPVMMLFTISADADQQPVMMP